MFVRVTLVDVNAKMIEAWRAAFEENEEVDIVHGSMLEQAVSAWVSPTNSKGSMDGGLDAVIKKHLGGKIEKSVQKEIARLYGGNLPVGHAVCVPTDAPQPRFLISTPTMRQSSEDISDTLNVALACAAAFQAVHMHNAIQPGSIRSVALPGLGAQTGRVPVEICADLMWTGYNLFRDAEFRDFAAIRAALEEQLGDLGPTSKKAKKKLTVPKGVEKPKPLPPKNPDVDFDDYED